VASVANARRLGCLLVPLLVVVVARGCVLRPATDYPGSHFNRGTNATWLDVDWVDEPKPDAAVAALAREPEATRSHRPGAENVASGLLGLLDGLNDDAARPGAVTGVAVYPQWETDEAEWRTYRALWLGRDY
jgi:hypothetical protein